MTPAPAPWLHPGSPVSAWGLLLLGVPRGFSYSSFARMDSPPSSPISYQLLSLCTMEMRSQRMMGVRDGSSSPSTHISRNPGQDCNPTGNKWLQRAWPGRHPLPNPTENLDPLPPKTTTQMMVFGPWQQVRMLSGCRGLRGAVDAHLGTTETPCKLCIPNLSGSEQLSSLHPPTNR